MTDVARAEQAPRNVFDVLRSKAAVAVMAGVAAGTLFGGIAKAGGKNAAPGSNSVELINGIENPLLDNPTFNSVHNLVTARSAEASDLQGPQVQFFDVITSDNNRTNPNPNIKPFISGVQAYARTHGDNRRVRVAQLNGEYTAPMLKIDMTSSQVIDNYFKTNTPGKITAAIADKINSGKYPTNERVNIALLDVDSGDACFTMPINAPNPANVEVINITDPGKCYSGNTSEGFGAMNVVATQGILWIPRTANFVRDSQDTMDDSSINGNFHNYLWYQTYINHSGTYGDSINTSGYWQRHLNVSKSGTGNGEVTEAPAADPCKQDCGTGMLYPAGTKVTIQAAAKTGSTFTGFANCPQVSGNSCIVPMTQEQNVTVKFKANTTPPPPKPKAYVIAQEIHGNKKIGSKAVNFNGDGKTIYNGKEYANGLTVVAKHVGQVITLKFKPAKGSAVSYAEPCPGHKVLTDGTEVCPVPANVVDNPKTAKIEAAKISVGYIKQSPPIQKSPVR